MSSKPEPPTIVVRTWGDQIAEEAIGREAVKEHIQSVWRLRNVIKAIALIPFLLIVGFIVFSVYKSLSH